MTEAKNHRSRPLGSRISSEELGHWRRLLDRLPDRRVDKIRAARDAIDRCEYDREAVLDETIRRMWLDLAM